jgi:hypothetical protein
MSLANLIVQGKRVVLQADAGAYWPSGEIAWLGAKIRTIVGLPIALTVRGNASYEILDRVIAGRVFDVPEDFLHALPEMAGDIERLMRVEYAGEPCFCFYVAAYLSGRGRPYGFMLTNSEAWFPGQGVAPFELKSVLNSIGTFTSASEMMGRPVDLSNPTSFDIERDSLDLIFAQRARPWADFPIGSQPGSIETIRIAGWIDQVEIAADGLKVSRLWEWPSDEVGSLPVPAIGRLPADPAACRLVHPSPPCVDA